MTGWWLLETHRNETVHARYVTPVEDTAFEPIVTPTEDIKLILRVSSGLGTIILDANDGDTYRFTANIKEVQDFLAQGIDD